MKVHEDKPVLPNDDKLYNSMEDDIDELETTIPSWSEIVVVISGVMILAGIIAFCVVYFQ